MKKKRKYIKQNNYFDSPEYKNKVIKNKNSYVGRTYKVSDDDLPHNNQDSGKIVDFAVIEENGNYVGGVRTTTRNTKNAMPFKKSKHRLYKGYKTFFVTDFQDGTPMKANDKRFRENPWINNLTNDNLDEISDKIFYHSKQAKYNAFIRDKLKNKKK